MLLRSIQSLVMNSSHLVARAIDQAEVKAAVSIEMLLYGKWKTKQQCIASILFCFLWSEQDLSTGVFVYFERRDGRRMAQKPHPTEIRTMAESSFRPDNPHIRKRH